MKKFSALNKYFCEYVPLKLSPRVVSWNRRKKSTVKKNHFDFFFKGLTTIVFLLSFFRIQKCSTDKCQDRRSKYQHLFLPFYALWKAGIACTSADFCKKKKVILGFFLINILANYTKIKNLASSASGPAMDNSHPNFLYLFLRELDVLC